MTTDLHAIDRERTLAWAHQIMRENGMRHLPVLQGGKLTGVISLHDLQFVEATRDFDPTTTTVERAMTMDICLTAPNTLVSEAARTMAEHGCDCAVVVDREKTVGMFTAVDALRALARVVEDDAESLTDAGPPS